MATKICRECGRTLSFGSFYVHPRMADGHLNKCKDCVRSRVGKHRQDNIDRILAYDRQRGDLPHRVLARKAYAQSSIGKERVAVGSTAWSKRNPEKIYATRAVSSAVKMGRLVKQPCSCGNPRSEGHHEDYTKPLDVIWMCRQCHAAYHKKLRSS